MKYTRSIGIGWSMDTGAEIDVHGRVAGQRLPRRLQVIHANEPFHLTARPLAVAPHELVSVLLIETLLFLPQMMSTLALLDDGERGRLRIDRAPHRGAGIRSGRFC